jgi:phage shock protein PspC (stress-responsive transcriptional regulator)
MDKTVVIGLNGHSAQFRLEGDAYDRLSQYLDRAAARLPADADRAEVLGDLEQSVGDKLVALLGSQDRAVTAADMDGILEEIGGYEGEDDQGVSKGLIPPRLRHLHRIRAGQQLAGVCAGLSAYADLDVGMVRFGFMVATTLTVGLAAVVYIVLAFVLPISDTADSPVPSRNRRLERIKDGQQIAGVCNGFAEYAEIKVSAVRAVFFFATLLTAGGFALVYAALALILPVRSARPVPAR